MPSAFAPGLSSVEDHSCPPGHWCPGGQGALLCPPGTFRAEPGASSWGDCELCPPGHYCPEAEQSGRANVFATPCRAGTECPAGETAALHPSQPLPPALHPRSSHKRPKEHHIGTAWPPAGPSKPSAWSPSVHPVFGWFRAFGSPQGKGPQPVSVSLRCCGRGHLQGWLLLQAPDWGPPALPWGLCLPCRLLNLHWPRSAVSTPTPPSESEAPQHVSASGLSNRGQHPQVPKGFRPNSGAQ